MSIARLASGTSEFLPISKTPENRTVVQLLDSTKLGDPPYHKRFHPVETVSFIGQRSYPRNAFWEDRRRRGQASASFVNQQPGFSFVGMGNRRMKTWARIGRRERGEMC
jgi:hypothetical protein